MVRVLSTLLRQSDRSARIQPEDIANKLAQQHGVDALVSFSMSGMAMGVCVRFGLALLWLAQ